MGAYQCWLAQRERLREAMSSTGDAAGAAYLTRHTLAQVEQNTMAEQPDDLLRQQAGILFSCVKTSLNLLDISVTTKVWIAQEVAQNSGRRAWAWLATVSLLALAVCGAWAWLSSQWTLFAGLIAAASLGVAGFLTYGRALRKRAVIDDDRVKVTARPDVDKLFRAIDVQMQAIDRYINDFAYLNEQSALSGGAPDDRHIAALADLMQAVYEVEGDEGEAAQTAAQRLLTGMGVRAVSFTPQEQRLFTVLPSVNDTRTLTPALLCEKDGALLRRGTAAVREVVPYLPVGDHAGAVDPALPPRSEA